MTRNSKSLKSENQPKKVECNHFIWKRVNNGSSIDYKGREIIVCEKCHGLGVIEEGKPKWGI